MRTTLDQGTATHAAGETGHAQGSGAGNGTGTCAGLGVVGSGDGEGWQCRELGLAAGSGVQDLDSGTAHG